VEEEKQQSTYSLPVLKAVP